MEFVRSLRQKAAALGKTIVLPEANDERMLRAACAIRDDSMGPIVLLGDPEAVRSQMTELGLDPEGITIVDPAQDDDLVAYTDAYFEKRQAKGITRDEAARTMLDPLFFGAMMVAKGRVDGMVAGAVNSTGNVLRAAFQIIGTAPGCSIVSSCFIMVREDWELGENGMIAFADCAVNPQPNSEQLSDIAYGTARTAKALCGFEPKVAMLSYSTMGSGVGQDVDKVEAAVGLLQGRHPELLLDGPIQADAALVPAIGAKKCPDSPVAGKANVLVFPDLDSGNIGYKLVQRLAGAEAVGPVMQGLAGAVNDLSRGCSVDDIVNVVAITALQSVD